MSKKHLEDKVVITGVSKTDRFKVGKDPYKLPGNGKDKPISRILGCNEGWVRHHIAPSVMNSPEGHLIHVYNFHRGKVALYLYTVPPTELVIEEELMYSPDGPIPLQGQVVRNSVLNLRSTLTDLLVHRYANKNLIRIGLIGEFFYELTIHPTYIGSDKKKASE